MDVRIEYLSKKKSRRFIEINGLEEDLDFTMMCKYSHMAGYEWSYEGMTLVFRYVGENEDWSEDFSVMVEVFNLCLGGYQHLVLHNEAVPKDFDGYPFSSN